MLTQIQLEAIYQRLNVNTEAIDRLLVRLNCHAEDITDHARRLEELEKRSEELEGGRDRIIPIKTHLASRQTMLEGRVDELAEQVVRHREGREADWARVAARVEKQDKRIEQLERLLERED